VLSGFKINSALEKGHEELVIRRPGKRLSAQESVILITAYLFTVI